MYLRLGNTASDGGIHIAIVLKTPSEQFEGQCSRLPDKDDPAQEVSP